MIRFLFGLIIFIIFAAGMVVMTPLPFLLKLGKVEAYGLRWSNAYGSMFQGGLDDVRLGPQRIGDVKLKLKPAEALKGRMQFDVDVTDGVGEVDGELYVGWNRVGFENVQADILLETLVGLKQEVRSLGGVVEVSIDELVFVDEACDAASGTIASDALTRAAEPYGRSVTDLTGTMECDGTMLNMPMMAQSESGDLIETRLRVGLKERSTAEAIITTADAQAGFVLLALGFSEVGGKFHFRRDRMIEVESR